jgi:putative hemolysin
LTTTTFCTPNQKISAESAASHAALDAGYPRRLDLLPSEELEAGAYRLRFARSDGELEAILRLRFEVFNLELGEGLEHSYLTGRDEDEFDANCHHLLVEHCEKNGDRRIVGTYRLQTVELAEAGSGFYTAGEYDLSALPPAMLANGVELGRACIAAEHRKKPVLFLLWRGLALYISHTRKRYFFGCCSLTSQDPIDGWRAYRQLEEAGALTAFQAPARPAFACAPPPPETELPPIVLPPLFDIYLRFGSQVCGPPALDSEFKTIDFLVCFDLERIDPRTRAMFFPADGDQS